MSGDKPGADLGAEREIDLRSWLDALRSRWWIAVAGLVVGAVIGGVYSLSGGSTYTATALIAPRPGVQPERQLAGPHATSRARPRSRRSRRRRLRSEYAAAKARHEPSAKLRGHVTTSTVNRQTRRPAREHEQRPRPDPVAARTGRSAPRTPRTRSPSCIKNADDLGLRQAVDRDLRGHARRTTQQRLKTLQTRINALNAALAKQQGLSPLDQLVLASQLDAAQAAYGQTLDSLDDDAAAADPGPAGRADADRPAGEGREDDGALAPELGRRRRGDRAPDRRDRRDRRRPARPPHASPPEPSAGRRVRSPGREGLVPHSRLQRGGHDRRGARADRRPRPRLAGDRRRRRLDRRHGRDRRGGGRDRDPPAEPRQGRRDPGGDRRGRRRHRRDPGRRHGVRPGRGAGADRADRARRRRRRLRLAPARRQAAAGVPLLAPRRQPLPLAGHERALQHDALGHGDRLQGVPHRGAPLARS